MTWEVVVGTILLVAGAIMYAWLKVSKVIW